MKPTHVTCVVPPLPQDHIPTMAAAPERQPPFVDISGLANFRDIGGQVIVDKESNGEVIGRVRKGFFYRGPDTATILPEGVEKLRNELGVTTDFDLRSRGQIEKAGGAMEMRGIRRVWCPAFPDGEYSPEKAALRYVQYSSDGTEVGLFLIYLSFLQSSVYLSYHA